MAHMKVSSTRGWENIGWKTANPAETMAVQMPVVMQNLEPNIFHATAMNMPLMTKEESPTGILGLAKYISEAMPLTPPPISCTGSRKADHPKVKTASPRVMKK